MLFVGGMLQLMSVICTMYMYVCVVVVYVCADVLESLP